MDPTPIIVANMIELEIEGVSYRREMKDKIKGKVYEPDLVKLVDNAVREIAEAIPESK